MKPIAACAAAVLSAALAACGPGDARPLSVTTTPPATEAPGLTSDPKVVGSMLKDVATAQESYALDASRYTTKVADLVAEGLVLDPRVTVRIVSATKDRYCVSVAGAGTLVRYYDSAKGTVGATPCT